MAGKKGSGCGGPKGNKHALGCTTNGRPREHDRNQIALDLIEWAKKEDSINFCGFCAEKLLVPSKLIQWSHDDDDFRQSYDIAKAMLGARREKHLNAELLHVKAYDLNASTYDYFLKDEKRKQAEFEASIAANKNEQATDDIKKQYQSTMSLLEELQSKVRKSSDKSNNKDK